MNNSGNLLRWILFAILVILGLIIEARYCWGEEIPVIVTKNLNGESRLIIIDLTNQKLYFTKDGKIELVEKISSGRRHRNGGGKTPKGKFKIIGKWPKRYSKEYRCWMPYCLKFYKRYNIHATMPKFYKYLGRPASHGCVRQHLDGAKKLYEFAQIGDPVIVI